MKSKNNSLLKVTVVGAVFIALTFLFKILAYSLPTPFVNKYFVYLRDYAYIGLFCFWGFSVRKRIMHPTVRRLLLAVAALMVFWFLVREFKFRFVLNSDISRYLWYLYYVPMLSVPSLALSVSISLDKGEDYRFGLRHRVIYLPTVIFIGLMLTNDFHQLAFRFFAGAPWDEWHYSYGWLYYLVSVWIYVCSFSAVGIMIKKFTAAQSKKRLWLPLLPIAVALVYGVLYAIQNPFISRLFNDLSAVFCLVFLSFFEICIQCSLIRSNSRYADLFYASKGISAQITDADYKLCYRASDAQTIPVEKMRLAEHSDILLENKKRLCNNAIHGGHAIWIEDISVLVRLRETLQMRREELADRNALLELEYRKEEEHKRIEEQNRLYDLLQSKTQTQLDAIEQLIARYKTAPDEEKKQRLLAKIIVLGSFIKRRKNFLLSVDEEELISDSFLSSALNESFRALHLLGIEGSFLVDCEQEFQSPLVLMEAYDFFECVIESVMDTAHFVNVTYTTLAGQKRITVFTDTPISASALNSVFPAAKSVEDEDGCLYRLCVEGGAPQ